MYKTATAILVLVFSVATANEEEGGAYLRIRNGDRAPPADYPWFAKGNGCGAVLVTSEFIITAGHCKEERFDRVRIGAVCTGDVNEGYNNCGSPFEVRYAKEMFEPDDVDGIWNDLRLVQLTVPSTIEPVNIDSGLSNTYAGGKANLWTAGFGDIGYAKRSDYLMHVETKYVSVADCKIAYEKEDWIDIEDGMICVQNDDVAKQACFGDSGGPLYDSDSNLLVGIVSTGNDSCEGLPVVYTRLASHYDWIKKTICQHSESKPEMCNESTPKQPENSTNEICSDNADFTFEIPYKGGRIKNCAWIQNDESKTEFRISRFCSKLSISSNCQKSCKVCTCADKPGNQFSRDSGFPSRCQWLQSKSTLIRQARYCYDESDNKSASDIAKVCPQSCGFCSP